MVTIWRAAVLLGTICAVGVAGLSAQAPSGTHAGVDWPGFRGIAARGVDDVTPPPDVLPTAASVETPVSAAPALVEAAKRGVMESQLRGNRV